MTKNVSDIEVLQKEILETNMQKPIKKTRAEAMGDEFFAFLEDVEPSCSVGLMAQNKLGDDFV